MVDFAAPSTGVGFVGQDNIRNDIYPAIDSEKTPSLKQVGKVVLVTGASRGIGRAIALQYARADVAVLFLVARSTAALEAIAKEVQGMNPNVKVFVRTVDVTSEDAVAGLAEDVKKTTNGRLDVLINNAGATDRWIPIVETKPSMWWNTMTVNLKGPYLFLHSFLPALVETAAAQKRGTHVVNVSSIGANIKMEGTSAYATSKLALDNISEFVTQEVGEKGVTCVSMHPGGVDTQMANEVDGRLDGLLIDKDELPGGWCVWMTAEERKWLSGRYVSATWDVDALEAKKEEIVKGDKLVKRLVT